MRQDVIIDHVRILVPLVVADSRDRIHLRPRPKGFQSEQVLRVDRSFPHVNDVLALVEEGKVTAPFKSCNKQTISRR